MTTRIAIALFLDGSLAGIACQARHLTDVSEAEAVEIAARYRKNHIEKGWLKEPGYRAIILDQSGYMVREASA